MKTLFEIRDSMDRAADAINRLEVMRSQIHSLARLTDDEGVRESGDELGQKLVETTPVVVRLC